MVTGKVKPNDARGGGFFYEPESSVLGITAGDLVIRPIGADYDAKAARAIAPPMSHLLPS
jgi:hypothetical protein